MQLRDYQTDAIVNVKRHIAKKIRRVLLQASTGAGKTVIASSIIQGAVTKQKDVLFIAHRKEIINQTSDKLDIFGVDHGVIMGNHPRYKPFHKVQVASIQTLNRRVKPPADLIIIDECHLSCSKSFLDLVDHYPDAVILGLTATPVRSDGKGLGMIYKALVEVVPMQQLIDEGHLVKPRVFAPFTPDMTGIKMKGADYDDQEAAEVMDKRSITGDIIKHWIQHAKGLKTIVFAASIKHSKHIQEEFVASGITCRHLDAESSPYERDSVMKDWRAGKFDVLTNFGLFIEGLDVPEIACVVLARPTKSLPIYLQAVGRGMRPALLKEFLIVLDHAGLTHMHGLVNEPREWSLDGKKKKSKRNEQPKESSVTICEECFAAYSQDEFDACPECGAVPKVKKKKAHAVHGDGELIELTAEHLELIKRRKKQELKAAKTIEDLIRLGAERGYKNPIKWAEHRIEERNSWRRK